MIVVVIIGILASVAIPSYQGFQDRAKATEAKVQLSAIYSAEKAYFSEQGKYSIKLADIGSSDTEVGRYYKAIGFKGNHIGGDVHASCIVAAAASATDGKIGTAAAGTGDDDPALGFRACAQKVAGSTSYSGSGTVAGFNVATDWWINERKELKNTAPN